MAEKETPFKVRDLMFVIRADVFEVQAPEAATCGNNTVLKFQLALKADPDEKAKQIKELKRRMADA
jgi:hypothetical protein